MKKEGQQAPYMIRCLSIFFVSDGAGNEVINPESEKIYI